MNETNNSSRDGEERSRREFLSKSARVLYVAPLVASYDIAEFYNEEEGYAQAPGHTPPSHHHGEK